MNRGIIRKFTKDGRRGYTLLFAVLTAALVLGVAVFILSISRGQYILSATARESTYAIYAADSGIECAAKSAKDLAASTDNTATMSCGATGSVSIGNFQPVSGGVTGMLNPIQASVTVGFIGNRCAKITFIKGTDNTPQQNPETRIESRGYNVCTSAVNGNITAWSPATTNPKIVERAIRLTYIGL